MLVVSLPCLIWWMIYWWRSGRLSRDVPASYGVLWYRQTLGAFVVLGSAAYLLLSLASLPARREANEKVDALIQQGEVAVLKKQNAD